MKIYDLLRRSFGHQHWWPAKTPFEVMIGAILTQNTSWSNVGKAIILLKGEGLLTYDGILSVGEGSLARLIRSSGYYNQKAKKLKNFAGFLKKDCGGDLKRLRRQQIGRLRGKLLDIDGVGPETADSILLYALGKKIFVVDAYTKRVFSRLGFIDEGDSYEEVQRFFMDNLPPSTGLYNDYHAQVVRLAKDICKKKPQCGICPLKAGCKYGRKTLIID